MAAARAQLDPNRATSDAVDCARAAINGSIRDALDPELHVSVNAPRTPVRVAVEAELVKRILAPLLENAARHAHESIKLAVEREDDGVLFTVEDDGPGVPAEEQEAIFEPGYRAKNSTATTAIVSTGAGLGLALCRRLARTAGGDVHAEPSERGARFIVRLPAA